eukprot:TRINITY_DN38449_c0_g1_i1.p1 TRINITY_DN38449_c0_g1~~TRINITY_DN38449_c0_g1_i1.p1  ORF type:complete len:442 (-),score=69.59 TRINITY_DN38449_c0_g1_i1:134-1459(-)
MASATVHPSNDTQQHAQVLVTTACGSCMDSTAELGFGSRLVDIADGELEAEVYQWLEAGLAEEEEEEGGEEKVAAVAARVPAPVEAACMEPAPLSAASPFFSVNSSTTQSGMALPAVSHTARATNPPRSSAESSSGGFAHASACGAGGGGGHNESGCCNRPLWLSSIGLRPNQEIILTLLQAICSALDAAGIPCWLTGGTLLGALRHGGFVPHDDDADLECFESDWPRIEAHLQARHLRLTCRRGGFWKQTPVAHVGLKTGEVELDFFLREATLEQHPDFPSKTEVFPLHTYLFHGVQLPGPNDPRSFLERLYGADWAANVRVWTHDFNFFHGLGHDPNRVLMARADYEALVAASGYTPPATPPRDDDEAFDLLYVAGGAVDAARAARDQEWLETLRRKNQEQTEARLSLRARGAAEEKGVSEKNGEGPFGEKEEERAAVG